MEGREIEREGKEIEREGRQIEGDKYVKWGL